MALPSLGTLKYGSLNLNSPNVLTRSIRSQPVLDKAGRGRMHTQHVIALKLTLAGSSPTDDAITNARQILNTPGLEFRYQDRGYGPLRINGQSDVLWGPQPRELSFKPLGGGGSCELEWEVTVAIACEDGETTLSTGAGVGEIIAWTYSATYEVDHAGYTTRRINVEIKVPGGRTGPRGLTRTADQYRLALAPPQVPGFRRTYPGWTIDDAKTSCTGEIVDEEMGVNFPPEWVAELTADHEVTSTSQGLAMWQATINAEYELVKAAPVPTINAAKHFIGVIVKDRVLAIASTLAGDANTIVPISLRMREPEIYGRRKAAFSFSFSYTRQLKDILGSTGLWRAVPGSNWTRWAASMQAGPANPRGFSGLELRPGDDSIVDGCGGTPPGVFVNGTPAPVPPLGPNVIGAPSAPAGFDREITTVFPPPTPEASWFHYECWYWIEVDSSTIPVPTLPPKLPKPPKFIPRQMWSNPFDPRPSGPNPPGVFDPFGNLLPGWEQALGGGARLDNKIEAQIRTKPLVYMFIRGQAARYGFSIPVPTLTQVNGAAPVMACRLDRGEGFGQGTVFAAGGAPIYGAVWNLRYQLTNLPKNWYPPTPPNSLLFK